jgi:hypothetical protein
MAGRAARIAAQCRAASDFDGPPPAPEPREQLLDGIERYRRRVRAPKADLHRVRSARFPASCAKAKARDHVDALAARGAPSVSELVELASPGA